MNFDACIDELEKIAQEESLPVNQSVLKQVLKNALASGVGMGAGMALAAGIEPGIRKLAPNLIKNPQLFKMVAGTLGSVATMGAAMAIGQQQQLAAQAAAKGMRKAKK